MNLPNSDYPLLEQAKISGVNEGEVLAFFDKGVADLMLNAFLAYSVDVLKDTEMLDGKSAVYGLNQGRIIFEDIIKDFRQQYNDKKEAESHDKA